MFVSMSWPMSIYVIWDIFFNLSLIFIVINHITRFKQKYLLFVHILENLLLFLDEMWLKKANNFQIAKVWPHILA